MAFTLFRPPLLPICPSAQWPKQLDRAERSRLGWGNGSKSYRASRRPGAHQLSPPPSHLQRVNGADLGESEVLGVITSHQPLALRGVDPCKVAVSQWKVKA